MTEFLIGAMISDMLAGAGAEVVGPATNENEGLGLACAEPLGAAILDLNLDGDNSELGGL